MTARTAPSDVASRAARTFVQAAAAYVTVTVSAGVQPTASAWQGLVAGAVAAGISAAMAALWGVPTAEPVTREPLPDGE
jgi:hypothetical protein